MGVAATVYYKPERTWRDTVVRLLDLLERRGSIAFSVLDGPKKTQEHLAIMLENWVQKAMNIGVPNSNSTNVYQRYVQQYKGLTLLCIMLVPFNG